MFWLWLMCLAACSGSHLFECPNINRCIRASYICDGDNHCGDWSDEQNCCESHFHHETTCWSTNPRRLLYRPVRSCLPQLQTTTKPHCMVIGTFGHFVVNTLYWTNVWHKWHHQLIKSITRFSIRKLSETAAVESKPLG